MLVLSRCEGESVDVLTTDGIISFSIERMSHLSTDRPKVRVGIAAPSQCRIVRSELELVQTPGDGNRAA